MLCVQVIGKLPFDDSNLKQLLKKVQAGPPFPDHIQVRLGREKASMLYRQMFY